MGLTPLQRRWRIEDILSADTEYCAMKEAYESVKVKFAEITETMPEEIQNLLWSYPGMGYLIHSRMLNIICDQMKFIDEDESPPQP